MVLPSSAHAAFHKAAHLFGLDLVVVPVDPETGLPPVAAMVAALDHEDVADAFGEIANVVGGNVKAALPGPSTLGLPQVGAAPAVRNPEDVCRLEVLWRGQPLVVSVQGALPPLSTPHEHLHQNGASL